VKQLFGALAVGTLVFGAVVASASSLDVQGGTVQVGTDASLACDTDGVTVAWNTNNLGIVTSAQVSGVNDSACAGQRLYLTALNGAGHIIGAGHANAVECGAPGDPISVSAPVITSGTTEYKIALGYVNPADDELSAGTYPCGVPGSAIEKVRIVIGV
jgi:hypothetical protein